MKLRCLIELSLVFVTICVNAEISVVMKPRVIKFVLGFLYIIPFLCLVKITLHINNYTS